MRLTSTSVHESGHAVIGEKLGCRVETITAVARPSQGYAGQVVYAEPPAGAWGAAKLRARMRANGITSLAGAVAQARYTHEPFREILQHCVGDCRDAMRCATGYALSLPQWNVDAHQQVLEDWLIETEDLVHENWRAILALARALTLNGTLQACDVARIIAMTDRQAA